MRLLLVYLFLSFASVLVAQTNYLPFKDTSYVDYVRTVQFYLVSGKGDSYPIAPVLSLNGNTRLRLRFDDLGVDQKTFFYTVTHYNADGKPSSLSPLDYIDGFTEEEIDELDFSFNTFTDYTNFELSLPNEDMQFTKSGQYLLQVYDTTNERKLVLTRRFLVVEDEVSVHVKAVSSAQVSLRDTHQELDIEVELRDFRVSNANTDLSISVWQNWRNDNAVNLLLPNFVRSNTVRWDYQNKIVFEGGKEFRHIDLRSLSFARQGVYNISRQQNVWEVIAVPDEKRARSPYLQSVDINGNFIIGNIDRNDDYLQSDYADVTFSLKSPTEYQEEELYLFGSLTDWDLKEEFKMHYNPKHEAYFATVYLKQGYYNYAYVTVPKGSSKPTFLYTEGNSYQTENNYLVLVHYRPRGARYDRIIAAQAYSTAP